VWAEVGKGAYFSEHVMYGYAYKYSMWPSPPKFEVKPEPPIGATMQVFATLVCLGNVADVGPGCETCFSPVWDAWKKEFEYQKSGENRSPKPTRPPAIPMPSDAAQRQQLLDLMQVKDTPRYDSVTSTEGDLATHPASTNKTAAGQRMCDVMHPRLRDRAGDWSRQYVVFETQNSFPMFIMTLTKTRASPYGPQQMMDAGCNVNRMKMLGVTASDVRVLGHTVQQMRGAGWALSEMKDAGFDAGLLLGGGCSASELRSAGFTALQLKDAGCSCRQLKDTRFSASELKAASFDLASLIAGGHDASELKSAAFTASDVRALGHTVQQMRGAGWALSEMKDAGFDAGLLLGGGCSASELRSAGFTALQLKDAGCSCRQLKDTGFSALQSRKASFTLVDLDAAGYGFEELKSMYGYEELAQVRACLFPA
jgi:hypothetical protein